MPYVSQILLVPYEVIFVGANNEINTMTSHIDLYKELEEEQVEGEFTEAKNLQELRRNKYATSILESGCYIQGTRLKEKMLPR